MVGLSISLAPPEPMPSTSIEPPVRSTLTAPPAVPLNGELPALLSGWNSPLPPTTMPLAPCELTNRPPAPPVAPVTFVAEMLAEASTVIAPASMPDAQEHTLVADSPSERKLTTPVAAGSASGRPSRLSVPATPETSMLQPWSTVRMTGVTPALPATDRGIDGLGGRIGRGCNALARHHLRIGHGCARQQGKSRGKDGVYYWH